MQNPAGDRFEPVLCRRQTGRERLTEGAAAAPEKEKENSALHNAWHPAANPNAHRTMLLWDCGSQPHPSQSHFHIPLQPKSCCTEQTGSLGTSQVVLSQ